MSVDSSLFAVDIPAGTYTKGDVLPLACIAGPANVRSGRGAAILKQIMCGFLNNLNPFWRVHVKNSDWVDEVQNLTGNLRNAVSMDDHSGLIQFGCDNPLTENSGWQIYAECLNTSTSTKANTVFCLIDIDYPSVSAINDPDTLIGVPTSISYDVAGLTPHAIGSASTATWVSKSVDYFKAGYQYCIQAIECYSASALCGFIAFSNAAGMGGLTRIVPFTGDVNSIRYKLRYATKLVKGPMDIKIMAFMETPAAADLFFVHDYVKRS